LTSVLRKLLIRPFKAREGVEISWIAKSNPWGGSKTGTKGFGFTELQFLSICLAIFLLFLIIEY